MTPERKAQIDECLNNRPVLIVEIESYHDPKTFQRSIISRNCEFSTLGQISDSILRHAKNKSGYSLEFTDLLTLEQRKRILMNEGFDFEFLYSEFSKLINRWKAKYQDDLLTLDQDITFE